MIAFDKNLVGCIGFTGEHKSNALQKLIKFFSNSEWSHTFLITFPFGGEDTVEEASLKVQIVPFSQYRNDGNATYEIYKINAPGELIDAALQKCFDQYAGVEYGFFQLLFFTVRWLYQKLGINTKHLPNPIRNGIICSELVWDYLSSIDPQIKDLLSVFDPDLVAPEDIYRIVKANPHIFALIERKS